MNKRSYGLTSPIQGVKMAKAIRPLAAQEAQEVLSMLSNLGFHQSKITDKQIEFSGDNLPTIYLHSIMIILMMKMSMTD